LIFLLPVLERVFCSDGRGFCAADCSVVFNRCCNYFMGVTMDELKEACSASEKILDFCEAQGMSSKTAALACLVSAASVGWSNKKELMQFFGLILDKAESEFGRNK
jgi:hypothetical protein